MKKKKNFTTVYFLFLLFFITIVAYSPSLKNDFTNWDDPLQVTNNLDIRELSVDNITTIFSSFYVKMYQPIPTISYTLEYAVYGLNATGYHCVNLLLHILNILLVFMLAMALTKKQSIAIITTSLFALHPLFVEVVAWVSARSTLLYSCFYLAAATCYLKFIIYNKRKFYFIALGFFLLSLLSKVMAITLPVLLVLFDLYIGRKISLKKVFLEKLPFFMLAFIFAILSILGRSRNSNIGIDFSFIDKLFITAYQLLWYAIKCIFPTNLSTYYANPKKTDGFLPVIYYLSPILLTCIGIVLYKLKKYWKYIIISVFFFLINISLVLKLIQVREQNTADRYSYLAYIGLFLIVGFLYEKIHHKLFKLTFKGLFIATCIYFASLTFKQTKVWKNSRTLWSNVVKHDKNIALALSNLGATYVNINNKKAEEYFLKAIAVDSNYVVPYNNLGYILRKKNKIYAEKYLLIAKELDSNYIYIYINFAAIYVEQDKEKSKKNILQAITLNAGKNNLYLNEKIEEQISLWEKKWKESIKK